MRNIFIKETYTKCGGETIPDPFPKTQYFQNLWINNLKVLHGLLLLYVKLRAIEMF